ncbi:MFS transporter [Fictibacillus nanhaiensis]|uniref:MFS transporter n=1 Tax=Fictibacillus nanhaiensis TaxID=742169 RepID=UPI00203E65A5|nr:MFS transporter [Fictibacillus nanhaiensis]MCM3732778.1 MFS transporter [Fictibacillus nanhaiensis]
MQSLRKNSHQETQPLYKNVKVMNLLGSKFISFLGDQIYLLALPLIVLQITGSAVSMGIIAAVERIPVFFQPIAGWIADTYNRKRILYFSDLSRGVLLLLLAVLYQTSTLEFWHIAAGALFMGWLTQLHNAAGFAFLPHLVQKERLHEANAWVEGLFQTAIIIGPALGGLLVSMTAPGVGLFLNALSFFLTFWMLTKIHIEYKNKVTSFNRRTFFHTFTTELKEGFKHVFHTKIIWYTNLALMISTFGTTMFLTLLIFHLKEVLLLKPAEIGIILSLGGIMAIAGALITNKMSCIFRYQTILMFAHLAGGLSIIGLAYSTTFLTVAITNAIGVLAACMINPCIRTIRQTYTPDVLLGRVQATSRWMTWILLPVSAMLSGYLASFTSSEFTITIGGVVTASTFLFYLLPAVRKA